MPNSPLTFRIATEADLPEIIRLLADDVLGSARENYSLPLPGYYTHAFQQIMEDPNNEQIVVEKEDRIIGTLQITYIFGLGFRGSRRAQVESVRVDSLVRGQGIGRAIFEWVIERTRAKGCTFLQLTTHKDRQDAHRFYHSLGFTSSHEGMKLNLQNPL